MALIRCSQCGNLASSRSAVCPICGNKIAAEQTTPPATENTPKVEAPIQESTPVVETPTEAAAPAQPKTLNEILAERQAKATLNDIHAEAAETTEAQDEKSEEKNSTQGIGVGMAAGMAAGASMNAGASHNSTPSHDYDDDVRTVEEYEFEIHRGKRKAGGFMIGCIVLLTIIIVLSVLYIKKLKDYETLNKSVKVLVDDNNDTHELQADILRSNAEDLVTELEKYKNDNDSMAIRYEEAVKMLAELEDDNKHTLDQLRRYQKEVETLKGIMRQYVRQIDSLNNVASNLKSENTSMKEKIKSQELLVSQAEERADELGTKVRQGAVIQVSAIKAYTLNANSKEVKAIKRASRLRVDFELTANALAEPGKKNVYICITDPEGYLLASPDMTTFNFEGTDIIASAVREVDYENNMVPVSIFYDGNNFSKGTYTIDIYIDGRHCGSAQQYFD